MPASSGVQLEGNTLSSIPDKETVSLTPGQFFGLETLNLGGFPYATSVEWLQLVNLLRNNPKLHTIKLRRIIFTGPTPADLETVHLPHLERIELMELQAMNANLIATFIEVQDTVHVHVTQDTTVNNDDISHWTEVDEPGAMFRLAQRLVAASYVPPPNYETFELSDDFILLDVDKLTIQVVCASSNELITVIRALGRRLFAPDQRPWIELLIRGTGFNSALRALIHTPFTVIRLEMDDDVLAHIIQSHLRFPNVAAVLMKAYDIPQSDQAHLKVKFKKFLKMHCRITLVPGAVRRQEGRSSFSLKWKRQRHGHHQITSSS